MVERFRGQIGTVFYEDLLATTEEEDVLAGYACSFTPSTVVTTSHGKQTIGTMHVGEQVLAYNPKTHKMELEPVEHVWIHTDNDLVDLTITTTTHAPHCTVGKKSSEVIHTNEKHPFYTLEQGFVPVRNLKLGMHVLRADGQIGVITGWKMVPGTKVMYNLEVAHDHTFTVGAGQWVVHNTCLGPREQYVLDNIDSLIPNHGANDPSEIIPESQLNAKAWGSTRPDFVTPNAVIEVTGANSDGSVPSKLMGGRGMNQLTNDVKYGGGRQVYLLYDGDTSAFTPKMWDFFARWNIQVIQFQGPPLN